MTDLRKSVTARRRRSFYNAGDVAYVISDDFYAEQPLKTSDVLGNVGGLGLGYAG